ncbi:3276_t:CDS:2, partial [Gigaspora margarita]
RSKLSKCGKDALDFVINKYAKLHNYDDLVKMQEIKVYLLHAYSYIHIEENLRLIKEIFNKNLDKDHISNYGSEDNDNNEGEEECEEISKMFSFILLIPTYNTPRSSIN